ncbi:MAG: [protein-PII] uridylyltransferase [Acidobacteriota bacterium]|nr:[protein-PII] uridylyltransferase [Acidobacteriota bacterium]
MALLLRGNELIATTALSAKVLTRLVRMAVRRPLIINGVELRSHDLERLAEEARQTAQPIWLGTPDAAHLAPSSTHDTNVDESSFTIPGFLEDEPAEGMTAPRSVQTHRQMVLRHAEQKLSDVSSLSDFEVTQRLRGFLKVEEERLRIAHRMAAAGQRTAAARSFVLDTFVTYLFRAAQQNGPGGGVNSAASSTLDARMGDCAVIALGGYGRSDLAPFSDLDLLFLHTGGRRSGASTRELIERVLHLLWDSGLSIGQKVHTLDECLAAWRTDPHFQTAMVNARLVIGDEALFARLTTALEQRRRKNPEALIATARHERAERAKKFGDAIYLQEPNVKEGAGGMRDLHTALWAAYARFGCRTLDELRAAEHISEDERIRATQSYDFLARVRHEAHWLAGRKTDRLALDLQPHIAERFGYRTSPHLQASEQFMRDYYRRARELHQFSEVLLARASERGERVLRWFNRARREQLAESFSIKNHELYFEGAPSLFTDNPLLLFEAVSLSQTANATFSHELRDTIRQRLTAVDRDFRAAPAPARLFREILNRRGRVGGALRLMNDVGLLGRYLPEFERISLLIQHDLYHHYTIDEHTLRAIDVLDELAVGGGAVNSHDRTQTQLREALAEIEDVAPLYLSLLLHDLGKGRGRGHIARGTVIAEHVCRRLNLDEAEAARIVLLVRHHVLMAHVSQRRDLSEPRLAADFAREVGGLGALNMLLLLTYADMSAVGPGVWSDWKGALLCDLYRRAREYFDGGETTVAVADEVARVKRQVLATLGNDETAAQIIEHHFRLLPERYARAANHETVLMHLRLIEELQSAGTEVISCHWLARADGTTGLSVAGRDRRGLFADLAGALAAQGVEILSANLNTRSDGIAVDNFEIRDAATRQAVAEHRRTRIERELRAAVSGSADVAALVERWQTRNAPRRLKAFTARPRSAPRVECSNRIADATTVVEVHAADEPGLAYKIASVLAGFGVNIVFARVATEKCDAFDVFYVTGDSGEKLSEAEASRLKAALVKSLAAPTGGADETESFTTYQSEVVAE